MQVAFLLILLISPLLLLWGWVKYFQISVRSDWRSRASLVGLSAPVLSVLIFLLAVLLAATKGWRTSTPAIHHMISVAVWVPLLGIDRSRWAPSPAVCYRSGFYRRGVVLVYVNNTLNQSRGLVAGNGRYHSVSQSEIVSDNGISRQLSFANWIILPFLSP